MGKSKKKTIKIVIIAIILSILIQSFTFSVFPVVSVAVETNIVNTSLGNVSIKIIPTGFEKDDIISFEIYIDGKDITSLVIDLDYDKDIFEELDVSQDISVAENWKVINAGISEEGLDSICFYASQDQYAKDNGIIGTINFKINETLNGNTDVKFKYIYLTNLDWEDNEDDMPNMSFELTNTIEDYLEVYNITYNSNTEEEVTNIPANETKTEREDYIISQLQPSREGYTFEGWNTKEDGTGISYNSGSEYKIDENLTLYAQWKEIPQPEDPQPEDPKPEEPAPIEKLYLSSNKYKIGDNDIHNYEDGDKYISRVIAKTDLIKYKYYLSTNGTIKVLKEDETELTEDEYVGTSMTLVVTKDEEKIESKIAVMGDLDGNGKVTATDLSTLNQNILKLITLEDEYAIAADLDENNKITATDLSTLNQILLGVI